MQTSIVVPGVGAELSVGLLRTKLRRTRMFHVKHSFAKKGAARIAYEPS